MNLSAAHLLAQIEELYRAFREQDDDAFRRVCAPGIEWIQNDGFPGGGHHHGADAVLQDVFHAFSARWSEFRYEVGQMIAADQAVPVTGYYHGRARETGTAFRAAAAHLYEFNADGMVYRYRQFADTKLLWDALAPEKHSGSR